MSNFADIINLAKTAIQSLVGFSYTLLPILLTLMMTTRKYCISKCSSTSITISNYIYRKYYNNIFTTAYSYWNSTKHYIENIGQGSNR